MEQARDWREQKHIELDDKNFTQWHEDNAKAGNSYNPPKVNQEDSRVNTGIVRERVSTLLSATLNYNFDASITAYEKSNTQVAGLGETLEDAVRKSRQIEHYDDKRRLFYKEIFDQGTAIAVEVKQEHIHVNKTLKNPKVASLDKLKWEKNIKRSMATLEVELVSGLGVYYGNFKEFFVQKQPYIFLREVIPYDNAEAIYGDFDRWKHVPHKMVELSPEEQDTQYYNWRLASIDNDLVEVIKYFDAPKNEFQIVLSGVMMLPIEFPMTVISPSGLYPMAKGDSEPISKFFAISRSIPSKTEVDQKLLDSTIRLLLLKTQRSLKPPLANNTNKILSRKVLYSGNITNGINPDQIATIGPTDGPSLAEFNMFNLMREINNGKSIDPVFAGEDQGREKTATEVIQRKQQQMMKLGQGLIGIMEFERQLVLLRTYNILANWTLPIGKQVDDVRKTITDTYQTFEIDTVFADSGKRGTRILSFNPRDKKSLSTDAIFALEQEIRDKTGREVRISMLDGEALRSAELVYEVDITPTEKNTSELERELFIQNVGQIGGLIGMQSFNLNYIKERLAVYMKEDPRKLFTAAESAPPTEEEGKEPDGGSLGAQMARGLQGAVKKPSLNTLART